MEKGKIWIWDGMQELINYLDEIIPNFDKKEFINRAEKRTKERKR